MIIGRQLQENEREQKIRKSQIYKEMLDQQIMIRDELRKGKASRYSEKDFDASIDNLVIPAVIGKQTQPIEASYVRQLEGKQQRQKSRFLPHIKDKNTLYRGSSRFIRMDDTAKPHKQSRHVKTEQIQQLSEDSHDQYNSTCQRIIKDLQSLTSKPVKFRHRRRLYDKSENNAHRRIGDRNNQERQHVHWQDQLYQPMPTLSVKTAKNMDQPFFPKTQSRYSQFLSTQLDKIKKEKNQFQESPVSNKERNITKTIQNPSETKNEFSNQEQSRKYPNPKYRVNTDLELSKIEPKHSRNNSQIDIATRNKVNSTINRPTTNQHHQFQSPPSVQLAKNVIDSRKKASTTSALNIEKIEATRKKQKEHQENFLSLLRKAKNRGELLCQRLTKIPAEKQPKNQ